MHRCFTGSTGAEDLALARLAPSLEHNTSNAPMPLLTPSVHPVLKNLLLGTLHRLWNIVYPMHRCLSWIRRFNRCLTDLHQKLGHRIIRQPSDAPMPIASVLPVLLKYLCLDFFDLDFFTVHRMRNHRRGGPSGLATPIYFIPGI